MYSIGHLIYYSNTIKYWILILLLQVSDFARGDFRFHLYFGHTGYISRLSLPRLEKCCTIQRLFTVPQQHPTSFSGNVKIAFAQIQSEYPSVYELVV